MQAAPSWRGRQQLHSSNFCLGRAASMLRPALASCWTASRRHNVNTFMWPTVRPSCGTAPAGAMQAWWPVKLGLHSCCKQAAGQLMAVTWLWPAMTQATPGCTGHRQWRLRTRWVPSQPLNDHHPHMIRSRISFCGQSGRAKLKPAHYRHGH